ncbi:type 4a pilus biogenesis protein PilO [Vibrio hepatarius]|uniref:type 4a pilus biogenesis protein PilO n=1 Tax=Vibrio hepatarius TaxID=171383 RepID=UPI001C096858|nr:type 4a pilus biogenesis protein PilO [Vibrio hepatarius]MBU2896959.1 type 4a pilus biogenesis protein PilO [Vibrio hepatarius]
MSNRQYFSLLSLAKLSTSVQCLFFAGYLIFIFVVAFFVYLNPQLKVLESLGEKEIQLIQVLNSNDNKVRLDKLSGELADLKKTEKRLRAQVTRSESLPQIVKRLSQIAEQHSLDLSSIVQGDSNSTDIAPILGLQIELHGHYSQVVDFFRSTAKSPYLIYFDKLQWSRVDRHDNALHVQGNVFFLAESLGNKNAS